MRVEPLAMELVPVSISLVPSFEPQPARTNAHTKAGRTRIGRLFLWGWRGGADQGLIAAGGETRNGARLAPKGPVWLVLEGLKRPCALPVRKIGLLSAFA